MKIRWQKRSVPAKWCFSAALATNFGKRVNPADTFCMCGKFAWIVTRIRCSCAWKQWDPASVMRDTRVASFVPSKQEAKPRPSRSERFHPKPSTERRKGDEPIEAGYPQRQPARSDAGPVCARGLENHIECAKLRANY